MTGLSHDDLSFGVIYSRLHPIVSPGAFGEMVESAGYKAVWATEGLANQKPALDPIVSMAALGAATQRIVIGSCVMLLPLRHPSIVAKEVASLDVITGGRIVLGIGVGGDTMSNPADYRAVEVSPEKRGARCDESLQLIKSLWRGERVQHRGRFYTLDDISVTPTPVQSPHPPIWAGGNVKGVFRRTARFCNGFVPMGTGSARYRSYWQQVMHYCDVYERAHDEITRAVHLYYCMGRNRREAHATVVRTLSERYGFEVSLPDENQFLYGTADDCARVIEDYRNAGVTHFVVNCARPLEEVVPDVEAFAEQVIVKFQ